MSYEFINQHKERGPLGVGGQTVAARGAGGRTLPAEEQSVSRTKDSLFIMNQLFKQKIDALDLRRKTSQICRLDGRPWLRVRGQVTSVSPGRNRHEGKCY